MLNGKRPKIDERLINDIQLAAPVEDAAADRADTPEKCSVEQSDRVTVIVQLKVALSAGPNATAGDSPWDWLSSSSS